MGYRCLGTFGEWELGPGPLRSVLEKFPASGTAKVFTRSLPPSCAQISPPLRLNGCSNLPKRFQRTQLRLNGFPNLSRKAPRNPQNEPKSFPNGGQWKGPGRPWAPSGKFSRCLGRLWGRFGTLGGRLWGPNGSNWSPRGCQEDPQEEP